jgi:cell division protein ZapD
VIVYEYPFSERIRTYLRVERLLDRLFELQAKDTATDHHFALQTLFELMDITSRADVRGDLLKDLDKQKSSLAAYKDNPNIDHHMLDGLLSQLDACHQGLSAIVGKPGQYLNESEWLTALRGRMGIPAGTCEFDLPGYHDWLHAPVAKRQAQLVDWSNGFVALRNALTLILRLLRDNSTPKTVTAPAGNYQQTLSQGRSFHLLRIEVPEASGLIPEISGNRLLIAVRFMKADEQRRLQPLKDDVSFVISLSS